MRTLGTEQAGLRAPYAVEKVCAEEGGAGTRWGVQGKDGRRICASPSPHCCVRGVMQTRSCLRRLKGWIPPLPIDPARHLAGGVVAGFPAELLRAQGRQINFCWQRILTVLIEDHYGSEIFSFKGRGRAKMFKAFHIC